MSENHPDVTSLPYVAVYPHEYMAILQSLSDGNFPEGYTFLNKDVFSSPIVNDRGQLVLSDDLINQCKTSIGKELETTYAIKNACTDSEMKNDLQQMIAQLENIKFFFENFKDGDYSSPNPRISNHLTRRATALMARATSTRVASAYHVGGKKCLSQKGGVEAKKILLAGLKKILFLKPSRILPIPLTTYTIPHVNIEQAQNKQFVYIINPPFILNEQGTVYTTTLGNAIPNGTVMVGTASESVRYFSPIMRDGKPSYWNSYISGFTEDLQQIFSGKCCPLPIMQIPNERGCTTLFLQEHTVVAHTSVESVFTQLHDKPIDNLYIFEYWNFCNSLLYYELVPAQENTENVVKLTTTFEHNFKGYKLEASPDLQTAEGGAPLKRYLFQNIASINKAIQRPFPLRPSPSQGGANKIHILGRLRNIHLKGRTKYVTYKKELIKLADAKKLDKKKTQK